MTTFLLNVNISHAAVRIGSIGLIFTATTVFIIYSEEIIITEGQYFGETLSGSVNDIL